MTEPPLLTEPLLAEPPTLEYAGTGTIGIPQARSACVLMLIVAILSGLCVGACFLSFSDNVAAHFLHTIIFIVTIVLAIQSGRLLARVGPEQTGGVRLVL